MKNLFVFDLDGTLLNSQLDILDSTLEGLNLIQQNGDYSIIATGRHWLTVREIAQKSQINELIGCNGSLYHNFKTNYTLWDQKFGHENLFELITFFLELNNIGFFLYSNNFIIRFQGEHFKANRIYYKTLKKNTELFYYEDEKKLWAKIKGNNFYKIIVLANDHLDFVKIKQIFEVKLKDRFNWLTGNYLTFEINPKGVNKWEGIKRYLAIKKIHFDNIITFGDGNNDIEMIKNATYGVVMGQGSHKLKEIAKNITNDNDNDGIYNFILNFYQKNDL